ncbi:uncharacterized protein LOC142384833 isoform X2 [Odontesthes bonariensis]|uniref:uncharacterized protein LOC142384833 isoform X2 n=1 Tax=Odontesthes bonariensis TaxID=219752 RepID=UPI003F58E55A
MKVLWISCLLIGTIACFPSQAGKDRRNGWTTNPMWPYFTSPFSFHLGPPGLNYEDPTGRSDGFSHHPALYHREGMNVAAVDGQGSPVLVEQFSPEEGQYGDPGAGSAGGRYGDPGAGSAGGRYGDPGAGSAGGRYGDPGAGSAGGRYGDPGAGSAGGRYGDPGAGSAGQVWSSRPYWLEENWNSAPSDHDNEPFFTDMSNREPLYTLDSHSDYHHQRKVVTQARFTPRGALRRQFSNSFGHSDPEALVSHDF